MSNVWIQGVGVVSPAGWGVGPFRRALANGVPLPVQPVSRPGWTRELEARRVPAPESKPAFLSHPRLRRTSPISHYAVSAALEALGSDAELVRSGRCRLGIVLCVMSGCVNYSRRFYDETLRDPATASPLVFPETVFNAPSSHLAALLGTTAINYTLVGDPGTFLLGVVTAVDWLRQGIVDGCLILGAEELDWLTADAFRLFTRSVTVADGAGALYLRQGEGAGGVRLGAISDARLFTDARSRAAAVEAAMKEVGEYDPKAVLVDGVQNVPLLDRAEVSSSGNWAETRISPRRVFGEGLMAAAAWQCIAAVDALADGSRKRSVVLLSGLNEHVMWAGFERV